MDKNITLNLRVNAQIKQQAEDVLRQLGIPMSTAIDIYLRQISMTGGIPFPVTLPLHSKPDEQRLKPAEEEENAQIAAASPLFRDEYR